MAIDLNKLAEKLKEQKGAGVLKDGRLTDKNPNNKGEDNASDRGTTLIPQRFA